MSLLDTFRMFGYYFFRRTFNMEKSIVQTPATYVDMYEAQGRLYMLPKTITFYTCMFMLLIFCSQQMQIFRNEKYACERTINSWELIM